MILSSVCIYGSEENKYKSLENILTYRILNQDLRYLMNLNDFNEKTSKY